ncbi:MAG TPA: class II aldolase/adducin family protein [Verrucomicrobiaceae bacterium]
MSAKTNLLHPRDELMQTMDRIYRYRMTTTSGGNLSIRDANGDVWITPSRVDKGNLHRDDMVCIRCNGSVEGRHPASSELPFHEAIYAARPDLGAIVHAHPVALVAFSIVGQVPDTRLFHQSHRICSAGGFAPYALPGSAALGEQIAAIFKQNHNCVILENHGVAVGGADLQEAFHRFEMFEFTAKTIIKASQLGEVHCLTDEQLKLSQHELPSFAEFDRGPADTREKEARHQLAAFIRRGYQQRLLVSKAGSFSARLDGDSFVITSHLLDRSAVEVDDFVLIANGRRERGKIPSRATPNHQAIYRRHPQINAIVNASPVNGTAFSVTDCPCDSRTIPESYVFLREVQKIPFGLQFGDGEDLARRMSPRNPIALLENDGVIVLGTSILDAFDRLEVLESTAEALINSRPLGKVTPMPEHVIKELAAAFSLD